MKKIINIFLLVLIYSTSIAQALHCDSLTTPNSTIQLIPMQDSTLFSYSNIASDSISFSQSYYVAQWVSVAEHSVVDTIINTLQWSSTGSGLPTYLYPSQIYKLDIVYNVSSIPPNYSLQCYYNIYEPFFGNTCQIPFTFDFGTTSIDNPNNEKVNAYPNPVKDYYIINKLPVNCEIFILDLTGRVILNYQTMEKEKRLNLSYLRKGCYLIEVRNTTIGKTIHKSKIIKL
ncbi:MAG: T9SS type A sorting domain-containing protein [Bacteroidetes bacterium]|nr:T9SS type A sorting domain-containing protein [Bacteroidota bacterium]